MLELMVLLLYDSQLSDSQTLVMMTMMRNKIRSASTLGLAGMM